MTKDTFLLEKWLELANDTFITSEKLMYEKLSTKKLLNIPAYLLHLSIELYLKAFLMNNNSGFNKGEKGHNLSLLFDQCLTIDSKLENLCFQTQEIPYKNNRIG